MIPNDGDMPRLTEMMRAGALDQFTRERVGGSTLLATKVSILTVSARVDCTLCERPMINTCRDNRPEIGHLVPAAWTPSGAGGWIVRSAAVAVVGHASMVLMCGRCNLRASDSLITPSMLNHDDHYVMGAASKPVSTKNDIYDLKRIDRIGW